MARRYFGTDGIRGRVGEGPIAPDFMLRLGWALGRVLHQASGARRPVVVIGKDTRISGYMFESALEAGLLAAGADVRLLGPMPTPAIAWLTTALGADAGIVISASHNPHEDNGIKFFSAQGTKLSDAEEDAIEAMLEQPFSTVPSDALGKASRVPDALERYAAFCRASVPPSFSLEGMKIALDCAHGATYQVAPTLFRALGAEVVAIGVAPDGLNINRGVGSTHLDALCAFVVQEEADLGLAFDGDGDRLQMVDRDGSPLDGDDLVYILALDWAQRGRLKGPVVGTLMSNYGLEQAFAARGIPFVRANVGDRYVHQALVEGGGVLGGEASGHLLCLDRASTGDAIVSALQVLDVVRRQKSGLRRLRAGLERTPQQTCNVRVGAAAKAVVAAPAVREALAAAEAEIRGRGRVLLRPSGTEPVVRVTVETADAALMQALLERLAGAVAAAA